MSKVTYDVADGHVRRDGIAVAEYDSETGLLDFLEGMANFRAPVVRWLNKQGMKVDVAPDIPEPGAPKPPEQAAPAPAATAPAAPSHSPIPAAEPAIPERVLEEAAEQRQRRRSMSELQLREKFPELPAFDKMAGDKTPAVVEHIRAKDPEFAAWYYEFRVIS